MEVLLVLCPHHMAGDFNEDILRCEPQSSLGLALDAQPRSATTALRGFESRPQSNYRQLRKRASRHVRKWFSLMLILGLLVFGMAIGGLAQVLLGSSARHIDWPMALGAGLGGSFVGGLLASLLAGDGLNLRPSGLIGSVVGALIVTAVAGWWQGRS
ncbi:MAG: GlsB/YeaQ/YmgE family stress response membrane protein [Microthrixaceae bacterium]